MVYRLALIALLSVYVVGCDSGGEEGALTDDDTVERGAPLIPGDAPLATGRSDSSVAAAVPAGPVERPNVTTAVQQRIDKWLTFYADSLNDYGDAKGTMYAGGTPLFNETSGKPVSKYEYIVVKHPERPWDQPFPATWKKSPEPKKKPKLTSLPAEDDEPKPKPKPRRKKKVAPKPAPEAPSAP